MPSNEHDNECRRLELAIQNANIGVWDCNVSTGEYYANEIWWEMLGYEANETTDNFTLFFKILHPEDKQIIIDSFDQLSSEGEDSFSVIVRLKHKKGDYRYIQDSGKVIEWDGEKPIRAVGTHQDVTERYNLSLESENNKLRLEAAIRGADLGVWDTHLITGENYSNDRWWTMLGYEPDEVDNLYNLFYERLHPEDTDKVNQAIDSLRIDGKDRFDLLVRVRHKNGKYLYLQDKAQAVEWGIDGKAVRLVGTHLDVTENHELNQQIKFHEQRLESAIRGADLGVWDSNVKTGMNYANDRWWTMFGYEPGEVENSFDFFFQIVHPDDGKRILDTISQLRQDVKDQFDLLVRVKHKDGTYRYIQDRGHVVEWENGRALRLIGTHLDVTENHQLTKELKFKEARLNSAIGGADLGVWDVNVKTGNHYANDRWFEMLGFKPDEVDDIFNFFNSRVHPEDQPRLLEEIRKLTEEGGNSFDLILRVRHKNGNYRYIQDRSQAVEWENGNAIRAIGTHLDVTETYELTDKLKINQARYEAAINGADMGIWELNLFSGESYTNDQYWHLLGYSPSEVEYSYDFVLSLLHEDDKDIPSKVISGLIRGQKESFDYYARLRHKNGHYIYVQDKGQVLDWDGQKPVKLIGTLLDITEFQELNNQLQLNETRLEAAINGADLGIWDLDLTTGLQVTNDRWWQMMGFEPKEFKSDLDFFISRVHPEDVSLIYQTVEKLESGEIRDIDIIVRLKHKEGYFITVLDRGLVIEWTSNNKVKRLIGTILDITDQVKHENQLYSALKERDNILEAIDNGFISLDLDLNVTYLNSTAQKILSIDESELSKVEFLALFDSELQIRLKSAISAVKKDELSRSFEIQDKEQETWLSFSLYMKKDGYGIFIQDITESKMYHEQMLENSIRAMENERNRIAKELHDGVLQEMTAAMLFADNIKNKLSSDSIIDSFQNLTDLLKKVTNDARRISHDLKVPELEKETLIHLLKRLTNNLNLASNIRFELTVRDLIEDTKLEERVKINAFRIVQELAVNILKHSQATKARVNLDITRELLKIEVEDNGIGIAKNDLRKAGIGFKNIQERLTQNNGNIEKVNRNQGGLLVKITIPI